MEPGDDGYKYPCPAAWFAKTMEEVGLVEQTGCDVYTLTYKLPMEVKQRHLAYRAIMEKARPELERQAREKAKAEMNS